MEASLVTGALVGGLSLIASVAPSDQFLYMGGALSIGLGVVFAASVGTMFVGAGGIMHQVSLYGGLTLFSGFMLYDTQKAIEKAKTYPDALFDPINQSLHIYLVIISWY